MSVARLGTEAGLMAMALVAACGGPNPPEGVGGMADTVVTSIDFRVSTDTLSSLQETRSYRSLVEARNAGGALVASPSIEWSSSAPEVATVDRRGIVLSVANGAAAIVATAGRVADTLELTVRQVVRSVVVSPSSPTVAGPGRTIPVSAEPQDGGGHPMDPRPVTWGVVDSSVATIDAEGNVTTGSPGQTSIVATIDEVVGSAALTVVPDLFFWSRGDSLHYAIDEPTGPSGARYPAFVLVHGSGEQTKAFNRVVSNPMVRRGFVALRFDKRGTGLSGGRLPNVGGEAEVRLLANDVLAAVEVLRNHPSVDTAQIGLVGVSQAGWIIPNAAARSSIAWTILWVGPTVTVGEEVYYSRLAEDPTRTFAELSDSLAAYTGPLGFDPLPDLLAMTGPGLWLFGGQDRSIPTIESVVVLENLVATAAKPFDWFVYADAGHCILLCTQEPIWPDVDDWLVRVGIAPPPAPRIPR